MKVRVCVRKGGRVNEDARVLLITNMIQKNQEGYTNYYVNYKAINRVLGYYLIKFTFSAQYDQGRTVTCFVQMHRKSLMKLNHAIAFLRSIQPSV